MSRIVRDNNRLFQKNKKFYIARCIHVDGKTERCDPVWYHQPPSLVLAGKPGVPLNTSGLKAVERLSDVRVKVLVCMLNHLQVGKSVSHVDNVDDAILRRAGDVWRLEYRASFTSYPNGESSTGCCMFGGSFK